MTAKCTAPKAAALAPTRAGLQPQDRRRAWISFWTALLPAPFIMAFAMIGVGLVSAVVPGASAPLLAVPALMAVFGAPISLPAFYLIGGAVFWRMIARNPDRRGPGIVEFLLAAFLTNHVPAAIAAFGIIALSPAGVELDQFSPDGAVITLFIGGLVVGLPNTLAFAVVYRRLMRGG
ncbi:MAG: hypothetical protein AAF899_06555 [Pseudomonadota bacterium]